ncbi:MAG: glutamine synthetase beta-grasp domain-containing protein [Oscillospiraceae bacterium]|jgi:glutamine synthetase|nr:glutamine synthetase beta-grasp domain-containing protein [Oscillospiraceae bacterium]
MRNSTEDVLRFVKDRDSDVKFIRLAFTDLTGAVKNISLAPDCLPRAFERGMEFNAAEFEGFGGGSALLFPDPGTLSVLPWRPSHGRVARLYCEIRGHDGVTAPYDTRSRLRAAAEELDLLGITLRILVSADFYLFRTDSDGNPTDRPFDDGGYFDIFPRDKGENVRREICSYLSEMSVSTIASYHAAGPGQNTIALAETDALCAADNIQTFKTVVGAVAGQNGLASLEALNGAALLPESKLALRVAVSARGGKAAMRDTDLPAKCNPYKEILKLVSSAANG